MKVMYICDSITNGAGIERVILVKANYLVDVLNYKVTIVVTNSKNKEPYYYISEKIEIINLNENLINAFGYLRYRKKLRKQIEETRPDILFVPTAKEGFLVPFIDNKVYKVREIHFNKKSRIIQHKNSKLLKKLLIYYFDKIENFIVRKYDKLVVLTKEDQLNWMHSDIEVINNCKTLKTLEVSKLDNKIAIAIGRLDYQKGFDLLIEAWKLIKNEEWKLEIYGDGPEKEKLLLKIKKLKLENKIFLKGTTKNIEKKLLESSIYILSSRHEGLPLVLLEAMECGLPLVSFECPCGPKDIIIHEKSGFLVENGNIDELANKVEELMNSFKLRKVLGERAKLESEKYSLEIIMKKWQNLIKIGSNHRGERWK